MWIGSNGVTRKVADIRKDPRVTLMYFNEAGFEYVTMVGRAVIDEDAARRQARRVHRRAARLRAVSGAHQGTAATPC